MPLFESPLSVQEVKPNSQASITDLFNIHLILTDKNRKKQFHLSGHTNS